MKLNLLLVAPLLQVSLAATVRRDTPPQAMTGHDSTPSKGGLSALGALLGQLTDIESLIKSVTPLLGPYLKNPVIVSAVADRFLTKAKLHSQTSEEPKYRKDAKRTIFRYGPFTMYGQGVRRFWTFGFALLISFVAKTTRRTISVSRPCWPRISIHH
jgi:hypothetical protein